MLFGVTVTCPDVALPVLKFVPVQELALVEDQLIVEEDPFTTEVGLAIIVAVGEGGGIFSHLLFVTLQVVTPGVQSALTEVEAKGLTSALL